MSTCDSHVLQKPGRRWSAREATVTEANVPSGALGIMQVVLTLQPGGAERLIIETTKRLRDRFRMIVCCLDDAGVWAPELQAVGVTVVALERGPGFRPRLAAAIAALARRHHIDVLHCHQYSPFVYGRLASLLSPNVRVIYTEHGRLSDDPPTRKRRAVNPWLHGRRVTICAVSAELREYMQEAGFPANSVHVVYNGIDCGSMPGPSDRYAARAALGIPSDVYAVGAVARLDPVKDFRTLIDGFSQAQVGGAHLYVVGDGPDRSALAAYARERGVSQRVHLTGHRDDVRALLPGFDVFVNSSISEGISLTILEAMAAGLPIVATRVGGTPEIITDGESGLLFPARDAAALAMSVRTLAGDPRLAQHLGAAARQNVENRFTVDRMVNRYAALYRAHGSH